MEKVFSVFNFDHVEKNNKKKHWFEVNTWNILSLNSISKLYSQYLYTLVDVIFAKTNSFTLIVVKWALTFYYKKL